MRCCFVSSSACAHDLSFAARTHNSFQLANEFFTKTILRPFIIRPCFVLFLKRHEISQHQNKPIAALCWPRPGFATQHLWQIDATTLFLLLPLFLFFSSFFFVCLISIFFFISSRGYFLSLSQLLFFPCLCVNFFVVWCFVSAMLKMPRSFY